MIDGRLVIVWFWIPVRCVWFSIRLFWFMRFPIRVLARSVRPIRFLMLWSVIRVVIRPLWPIGFFIGSCWSIWFSVWSIWPMRLFVG